MTRSWLPTRRALALAAAPLVLAALGGCAAMRSLSNEVATYGEWPAERKPGRYAFERLPSQQTQPEAMQRLEDAARDALAQAGFSAAAAGETPDVLVQVGARSQRADLYPVADPLWWRGGIGYTRHRPWGGPRWGMSLYYEQPRYDRQVAVLVRDAASGKPLYEARAANEGSVAQASDVLLAAMFRAALVDFPRLGVNPRTVVIDLPQ